VGRPGERPQPRGVQASRGECASGGRQQAETERRQVARPGAAEGPKPDEPQDRLQGAQRGRRRQRERACRARSGQMTPAETGESRRKQRWRDRGRSRRRGDPRERRRESDARTGCGDTVEVGRNDEDGTLVRRDWHRLHRRARETGRVLRHTRRDRVWPGTEVATSVPGRRPHTAHVDGGAIPLRVGRPRRPGPGLREEGRSREPRSQARQRSLQTGSPGRGTFDKPHERQSERAGDDPRGDAGGGVESDRPRAKRSRKRRRERRRDGECRTG
jgi:hypothetical protein